MTTLRISITRARGPLAGDRCVALTADQPPEAITYLTLYGAYASTVFWVIGHGKLWLVNKIGE